MATFRDRIELVVDVVTGQARGGLKQLSTDIGNADGAFAKMRVAGAGAFDFIKANAATFAVAAGAAIAGFGVKAVSDLQEVALGAGELRDALGVTAEEASRLQEVATDVGIPISALESTIGKMNRTAADTPAAFDAIGASIVRNRDGTINVTDTLLSTIDALNNIPDASRRASAAQEIFGRSWQDIAELVTMGADDVREAMDQVEDGKIFTDEQVDRARKLRDALDELKGKLENATLKIADGLTPALIGAADTAAVLIEWIGKLGEALDKDIGGEHGFNLFKTGADLIDDFKFHFKVLDDTIRGADIHGQIADISEELDEFAGGDFGGAIDDVAGSAERLAAAQDLAKKAAQEHQEQLLAEAQQLRDTADAARASVDADFALRDAAREATQASKDYADAVKESGKDSDEAADKLDDATEAHLNLADAEVRSADEAYRAAGRQLTLADKLDISNRSLLTQVSTLEGPEKLALLAHIGRLNGIPPLTLTLISALIDQGKIAEAETVLRETSKTRPAYIKAEATNVSETDAALDALAAQQRTARIRIATSKLGGFGGHSGIPAFQGGGVTLLGEHGPELGFLPDGTKVVSQSETKRELAAAMGGGGVTNVYATIQTGADPNSVVRAIERYVKRNGPGVVRKWAG